MGDTSVVILAAALNRSYFGSMRYSQEYVELFHSSFPNDWTVADGLGVVGVMNDTPPDLVTLSGAVIRGVSYGLLGVGSSAVPFPQTARLGQNYPNPFNPGTNIGFQVTGHGFVSLKVYDVLGREVATLVNEVMEPGRYEKTWDGSAAGSGVYFYRLRSANATITKRMLLIR